MLRREDEGRGEGEWEYLRDVLDVLGGEEAEKLEGFDFNGVLLGEDGFPELSVKDFFVLVSDQLELKLLRLALVQAKKKSAHLCLEL